MLTLHRAVAYQLQTRSVPEAERQPEVTVFFEAEGDSAAVAARLIRLLALTWGCDAADVEFYNLWTEAELQAQSLCDPSAGDARLLENGYVHGPLFCRRLHTLMLVRPLTLARLQRAREVAARVQAAHMTANGVACTVAPPQRPCRVDMRPEFEALSEMGGFC